MNAYILALRTGLFSLALLGTIGAATDGAQSVTPDETVRSGRRMLERLPYYGVVEVGNTIEVLPTSQNDDRIRWATYYRIYTGRLRVAVRPWRCVRRLAGTEDERHSRACSQSADIPSTSS